MVAYKLVKLMRNGGLRSLFIDNKTDLETGVWLEAQDRPTKGYAHRPGWHCCLKPEAPHLSTKNRVWVEVEIMSYELHHRPETQGGTWVTAEWMKIIKILPI